MVTVPSAALDRVLVGERCPQQQPAGGRHVGGRVVDAGDHEIGVLPQHIVEVAVTREESPVDVGELGIDLVLVQIEHSLDDHRRT